MTQQFSSLEEINTHYDGQISAADEADRPALEAEKWRTVAGFHQAQVVERDLRTARNEAINKYPRARMEEVRGATAEELEASAKASHDFYEAALATERERIEREVTERVGTQMYGPGSRGGGGTGGPPPTTGTPDADEAKVQEIMAKVRSGVGRLTEADEQLIARVRLLPATQRLDFQWVIDEAARRGINLPSIEEILK